MRDYRAKVMEQPEEGALDVRIEDWLAAVAWGVAERGELCLR
jgi:hypothetical protein